MRQKYGLFVLRGRLIHMVMDILYEYYGHFLFLFSSSNAHMMVTDFVGLFALAHLMDSAALGMEHGSISSCFCDGWDLGMADIRGFRLLCLELWMDGWMAGLGKLGGAWYG